MSEKNIPMLDLDEMLGQTKVVKVRRHGIEYVFADLNGMGVHKILQFQSMRQRIVRLQMLDDISEEQALEIEKLFDKMLGALCADLPLNEITYTEKTTILGFYFTETAPKKARSPKQ